MLQDCPVCGEEPYPSATGFRGRIWWHLSCESCADGVGTTAVVEGDTLLAACGLWNELDEGDLAECNKCCQETPWVEMSGAGYCMVCSEN